MSPSDRSIRPLRPLSSPLRVPGPFGVAVVWVFLGVVGCAEADDQTSSGPATSAEVTAFLGATIWDGTGAPAVPGAAMLVQDGRVLAIGPAADIDVPAGSREVRLDGRWITPGFINAHGHVGGTVEEDQARSGSLEELRRYARFGVTTVNSLGGAPPVAEQLRDVHTPQQGGESPRARLLMAGAVVTGTTPDEATAVVETNASLGVDYIKIRVDDNLGATRRMTPDVYRAVIEAAHARDLPLSAHVFYLDDTKDLLRSGADLIGHSVRDAPADQELASLLVDREVCYVPTLMREVSTFVYRERPDFMDDPFLASDVDSAQVRTVESPEYRDGQATSRSAALYEEALEVAKANLKSLSDAGVTIAMGTDTGPLGRFQGYFEHLELELMVEAGLTPEETLLTATRNAARCIGRPDLGSLVAGNAADFLVFGSDPLADITNTRTLAQVLVAGRPVPSR